MSSLNDVLDTWEEMDEVKLNSQLHQIRREIDISNEIAHENNIPRMFLHSDDDYVNSYTKPSKPVVTILRRPTNSTSDVKLTESKPKHPVKTLEEREKEYAEARLRILGSAKNPEDEMTLSQMLVNAMSTATNISPCAKSLYEIRDNGAVLRMPKGPDGTSGFHIRRGDYNIARSHLPESLKFGSVAQYL